MTGAGSPASSGSEGPIRVVVADDHQLVREGIRRVLEEDPGVRVVGEAGDGASALARVREAEPDVLVLDISMPEPSGLEITERLREERPACRILVLSMHDDAEYVLRAVRAGAAGYLLKDEAGPARLREAVRAVRAGRSIYSPTVATRLAEALRQGEDETGSAAEGLERLTERERQVLRWVAEGESSKQIAARFGISRRTVESHRESLMRKLEIHSIAGLTRFAIQAGLLPEVDPRP